MKETLDRLQQLQVDDLKIHSLKAEIAEQPRKLDEIAAKRESARAEVKAAEDGLEAIEHDRRGREGDLQTEVERLKKYKTQLGQVKTNKEYTAMLHEIETTEKKIGDLEEQILLGMDEADAARSKLAEVRQSAALVEQACREEEERVRGRTAEAEAELAAAEADRKRLAAETAPDALRRYEQIRAAMRGVAVAKARKGLCGACGVELPPQLYNQLFQDSEIHTCPGCQRIMYVDAEAEREKS